MSGCLGDEKMIVQKKTKGGGVPGTSTNSFTVQYYPVHVHMHMYTFRLLGSVTLVYMSCTTCMCVVQSTNTRITKVQKVIFIQPTLVCIFHARLSLDSFSFSILLFLPF